MAEKHPFIKVFSRRREASSGAEEIREPHAAAVVVAAGGSTRMGGGSKQLMPLGGVPVLARSLLALEEARLVEEIVVVAREEDMLSFYDLCRRYEITKASVIIRGGATRQQSVMIGVTQVRPDTAYLAIHDGARPLIRPERVDEIIRQAALHGAATAAVPVKDTVKEADSDGFIRSTPDRSRLWNVQTPQVFEREMYWKALRAAEQEGRDYTDDCQLVEHLGVRVRLVQADYANIKITTPEDIRMAESLLGADMPETGFETPAAEGFLPDTVFKEEQ